MAKGLSTFTRVTLLITELNSNRIEDLADTTRCDIAHHTAKLIEDIEDPTQKDQAREIDVAGKALVDDIVAGQFNEAENQRSQLVTSCKRLKDLL